jgi:hypothetical protein
MPARKIEPSEDSRNRQAHLLTAELALASSGRSPTRRRNAPGLFPAFHVLAERNRGQHSRQSVGLDARPTISREKRSMTTATYRQPYQMRT